MSIIFSTAFAGTGMTLSSNYYMRNYYVSNRDAGTSAKRSQFSNSELSLEDSMALKRAVKNLGSFDYSASENTDIRNSVLAYINTYNNALDSASNSTDNVLNRTAKQMKSLTNEYSRDLDKIGITVNADGTLKSRTSLFQTADLSKFEELFSKDSDYMQQTTAYAKRISRQSEELVLTEQSERAAAAKKNASDIVPPTGDNTLAEIGPAPAAQLMTAAMDLDTLLNTGIGSKINLSL